ncbi:tetratricopeptide repeat protein [Paenibacillus apiarius]|uniref:tetratricopeptide repeat protein n=1 Tax=Paenibacillus apiarius TaxID=46240 RepID=UPI003B3BAB29
MAEQKPLCTKENHVMEQDNVVGFPADAVAFSERAVKSLDRLHYDKALRYFRKAVECESDNPIHQCNLAGALAETGRFEESNQILAYIVNELDPDMNECYYYMANNFAYMEQFEESEMMLGMYLSRERHGVYAEEAEEMLEMLHYELNRPFDPARRTKSAGDVAAEDELTEGKDSGAADSVHGAGGNGTANEPDERDTLEQTAEDHEQARLLLEAGRFVEAEKVLQRILEADPDFLAARNNLALAYYYMGRFDEARETLNGVLERDLGNLHALCNLAIFERHAGHEVTVRSLLDILVKIEPFHREHVFKLATTMGILDEHEQAYRHLHRLVARGMQREPSLYHYAAVAACHMGRYDEAARWWASCRRLDPESGVATYFLEQLQQRGEGGLDPMPSYHYRLPYEETSRKAQERAARSAARKRMEDQASAVDGEDWEQQIKSDPLVRSSLFWALRFGEPEVKLQALQAMSLLADEEAKEALRTLLLDPGQDAYMKQVTLYVLRLLGVKGPIDVQWDDERIQISSNHIANRLPTWEPHWQQVLDTVRDYMKEEYDLFQMHDAETLWIEFITRLYPDDVPRITKASSWAAALEYLIAKMYRRPLSYQDVAVRYEVSAATVAKHVKRMEDTCQVEDRLKQTLKF